MKFVDLCRFRVHAGKGGDGLISFRRDPGSAKIRPDGGNGGDGGNVIFRADPSLDTLYDFTHQLLFKAEDGQRGGPNKKQGKKGKDLILRVPVGTIVKEIKPRPQILADLVYPGQQTIIARGGKGGRGNAALPRDLEKTSLKEGRLFIGSGKRKFRQAWAEKGMSGEFKEVELELRLIADIGIIGLPNAGKTSLLNRLTHAKATVGSYPFTTLEPNLGVLKINPTATFIIADIPGLIEGAAKGRGLGDQFLRHIERTNLLLHVIDPLEGEEDGLLSNAWKNYQIIRKELASWSEGLLKKKEIILINKADITEIQTSFSKLKKFFWRQLKSSSYFLGIFLISSVTGQGLEVLKKELLDLRQRLFVKKDERHIVTPSLTLRDSKITQDYLDKILQNITKYSRVYKDTDLRSR